MLADPCRLVLEHPACVVLHELRDEFDVSVIHDEVLVAADRARVVGDDETVLRQSSDRTNFINEKGIQVDVPQYKISVSAYKSVHLQSSSGTAATPCRSHTSPDRLGTPYRPERARVDEKRKLRKRSAMWHSKDVKRDANL